MKWEWTAKDDCNYNEYDLQAGGLYLVRHKGRTPLVCEAIEREEKRYIQRTDVDFEEKMVTIAEWLDPHTNRTFPRDHFDLYCKIELT